MENELMVEPDQMENYFPPSIDNWHCWHEGADWEYGYEYPIWSDSHLIGEIPIYGPYTIFNLIAGEEKEMTHRILLRYQFHLNWKIPNYSKTNTETYHGGGLSDEISALLSLDLGVRLMSGPQTRIFRQIDLVGTPISFSRESSGFLRDEREKNIWIIPNVVRSNVDLTNATLFKRMHLLEEKNARSIVKIARLYQKGIWIAESNPEISWLLLVSAVEAAAATWAKDSESAEDKFRHTFPDISSRLESLEDKSIFSEIAQRLSDITGSSAKFRKFLLEFLPDPPSKRPPEFAQLNWNRRKLRQVFYKIYEIRSHALHAGTPFPIAMSSARKFEEVPEEIPFGMGSSYGYSTWLKEDLPLTLNTFEYIARGALRNWWASLLPEETEAE